MKWRAPLVGVLLIATGCGTGTGATAPPEGVEVRIIEPSAGAEVPAGEPIAIEAEVTGAAVADDPTATDEGHFHIFVDGELQEMLYANATQVTLEPGRHTITVEYTGASHVSYDPPIEESIEVTAT